jgi:class 3 adenylate cyclase/tetratricopeptide (TPR) repeat protein
MICLYCGVDSREGRRFCAACGKRLPAACAQCGFLNEPEERFCGGCGAAVDGEATRAPPVPSARSAETPATPATIASADRRPVCVLFVDLTGYTALSATLDPEDTHRLLRRFFELVDSIVLSFGGAIDKHIGDSVMALFGAPVAHGNDPERAVRAALAIQAAIPDFARETAKGLQVHLGIALGEVVASDLGSPAHAAYTVTGNAANLAARLMERAAPGETLVADAVRCAAEHVARFEALGPQALKGLPQPEPVHRLLGLRSERAADPAMVGRQAELRQLVAMLDDCRGSRRGGAVAIRGDPGIGKSRLLREARTHATKQGFRCISGAVLDFGEHKRQDALAALTAGLLDISLDASEAETAQAVHAACAQGRVGETDVPFLHDLLGLAQLDEHQALYGAMDVQARRRGMARALAALLRHATHDRPCLIAVEDVHWANDATLDLLARLAGEAMRHAAIVVMTTRFDGDPLDAAWRAQAAGSLSVTIDLRALRAEDATELAAGIIAEIDDFARQCIERAAGNPLFLEHLLRSRLIDSEGTLPHSLQGVILARLDSLGEADRRALQAASVLGQRFGEEDLRALLESAGHDCRAMIQRQLLRPDGEGYLFAHALIRDGVYASLTRERRRELHRRAAARFAERDPVLQAEHLDRAEDPAAARAYLRAAEAEAAAFRPDRANVLAERGLALASHDEDRVALALVAGRLRLDVGLAKSARDAFAIVVERAQDAVDRCRGHIGLAASNRILTDLDQALEDLRAAEAIARTAEPPVLLCEIHYMRGNLLFARGQGDACREQHRLSLELAERAGLSEWRVRALSGLGDAAYLQGRILTAQRHFEACVELAEHHNLLRVIPPNRCMIGDCLGLALEIERALSEIRAARMEAVKIGDRFCEMFAYESEAYVAVLTGRLDRLEEPTVLAIELAIALGARRYEAFLRMALAVVHLEQGRRADAEKLLNAAQSLAEETGVSFCGPWICGTQAQLSRSVEDGRAWIARGERMLAHANFVHNHVFFYRAAIEWAVGAADWPAAERFAQALADYTREEPLAYVDLLIRRARALAALGRDPQDREAREALCAVEATARAVDVRLPPRWQA